MFAPKDYLLVECANLKQTLRETLRYRYGASSAEFYTECASRLKYVRHLIDGVAADDYPALSGLMGQLNGLSDLITAIERSHIEEFAWPFAKALQRISTSICKENDPLRETPLFFFRAEGGIVSYAVRAERNSPGIAGRKIYSVVFPRTLKDIVLLHAIIGHEIGHAAVASHPVALISIAKTLVSGSILEDQQQFYHWCATNISVSHEVSADYLREQATMWTEELFCDLFGLIVMGPAFLPAASSLLGATSRRVGVPFVPSHPPYGCRVAALLLAARTLKLLYSESPAGGRLAELCSPLDTAFVSEASKWTSGNFDILKPDSIESAAKALAAFARQFEFLSFGEPNAELLDQQLQLLRARVPPAGRYPAAVGEGSHVIKMVESTIIDFRHVLLAGWLRWSELATSAEADFRQINRLCSHAILQQEAITYWSAHSQATIT